MTRKSLCLVSIFAAMVAVGLVWSQTASTPTEHNDMTTIAVPPMATPAPDQPPPPASIQMPTLLAKPDASYDMPVGSRRIPLFPADPLSEAPRVFFSPHAPQITRHTYDPVTGRGSIGIRFHASEVARWQAQQYLADIIRGKGHAIEAREIAITTLPLEGYRVSLRVAGKSYLLTDMPRSPNTKHVIGEVVLSYAIPSEHTDANLVLSVHPREAAIQIETTHDFKRLIRESATAELLRSTAQRVLDEMAGKGEPIVDRKGKQEFFQRMVQHLRLSTHGNYSEASKNALAWVEKQLENAVHPISISELLTMPDKFHIYTVQHGQKHLLGETYDKTTNKELAHNKIKQEADYWAKAIKTASEKKQGEEAFHNELKESQKINAEGGGWGVSLKFGLDKEYSKLNKQERKNLTEAYNHGHDENSTRSRLETDFKKEWEGTGRVNGVKAPSIDLYRLSAQGIAARSVFQRDHTVTVGEQAMTYTHMLACEVEKQDQRPLDVLDKVKEEIKDQHGKIKKLEAYHDVILRLVQENRKLNKELNEMRNSGERLKNALEKLIKPGLLRVAEFEMNIGPIPRHPEHIFYPMTRKGAANPKNENTPNLEAVALAAKNCAMFSEAFGEEIVASWVTPTRGFHEISPPNGQLIGFESKVVGRNKLVVIATAGGGQPVPRGFHAKLVVLYLEK